MCTLIAKTNRRRGHQANRLTMSPTLIKLQINIDFERGLLAMLALLRTLTGVCFREKQEHWQVAWRGGDGGLEGGGGQ